MRALALAALLWDWARFELGRPFGKRWGSPERY